MAVTLTVLGSGSGGNCTVLSSARTQVLIDAGFSCKETLRRMAAAGLNAAATDAILVTHEHLDHIKGVERLARVLKVPVFMTEGTHHGWRRWAREKLGPAAKLARMESFTSGLRFTIGDITVQSFTIPHDSLDPVGFTFKVEGIKLAVVTDLGYMPANVAHQLHGCQVLMIESNHDLEMLRSGPYPWHVKQRVMSKRGHLSNEALADFFCAQYDGAAAYVILAHLSEQNNVPEIARRVAERALEGWPKLPSERLLLASQGKPLQSVRL
ncbi:MAG: MBL fold metallo-hydrolase [Terriglobales bacterium]